MSSINNYWRVRISRCTKAIAEQVRSASNKLKVWVGRKGVCIDYFLSDTLYLIEGGACILTWSVSNAYRVELSDGLGKYTQLRYGIHVLGADLPERLTLTAHGLKGAVQAELFFTHIRGNHQPVNAPVYVPRGHITLKPNAFFSANLSMTPRLQLNTPQMPVTPTYLVVDNTQLDKWMQSIYTPDDLTN